VSFCRRQKIRLTTGIGANTVNFAPHPSPPHQPHAEPDFEGRALSMTALCAAAARPPLGAVID